MYDLHQYLHGACEAGAYRITNFNASGCSAPKSCGDLGAMCQQIWHNDDDIAACVRANSFTPRHTSTMAMSTAEDFTALYKQCCGPLSSPCLGNVDHYSCHWDAEQKKGVHNGPTEAGVCNIKDYADAGPAICETHTHQTKQKCLSHTDSDGNALCQWDPTPPQTTAQPKVATSGCAFALSPQVWKKTQDYHAALSWSSR